MSRDFALNLLQLIDAAIEGRPIASRRTSPLLMGFASQLEQAINAPPQPPDVDGKAALPTVQA
jgi:hypothetical protein